MLSAGVIVSLHVATGGLAGALAGTRLGALALSPLVHLAGDLVPHRDIGSTRFEAASGVGAVLLLGVTRGFGDPATIGAVASSAPDLEHVLRLPRPGGRKLFPSHRTENLHKRGDFLPTSLQLVAAAAILATLAAGWRLERD